MKKIISLLLMLTCLFQATTSRADDNILNKKYEEFQKVASVFYKKIENLDENRLNTISSKIDIVFNKSYNECKKHYPIITNTNFSISETPKSFLLYDFINGKDVNSLSKDFFKNKNCYNTFLLLSLKQVIFDKNSEKQLIKDFENKAEIFSYSNNPPDNNFYSEPYFSRQINNINIWKVIDNIDWKSCSIYWNYWKLKVINYWKVWEIAKKYNEWDNSYDNVNYWGTKQFYDSNAELKDKNNNVLLSEEDSYFFDSIKLYFVATDNEKLKELYNKIYKITDSNDFDEDEYNNLVKQIKQYFLIAINLPKNDILNKFNMSILSKARQVDWGFIQLISKKDYEYNLDNNSIFVLKCSN